MTNFASSTYLPRTSLSTESVSMVFTHGSFSSNWSLGLISRRENLREATLYWFTLPLIGEEILWIEILVMIIRQYYLSTTIPCYINTSVHFNVSILRNFNTPIPVLQYLVTLILRYTSVSQYFETLIHRYYGTR